MFFFSFWSLLNLSLKSIVTDTWLSGHQIVSAIQSTKWYLKCNWRLWKTTLSVTVSYKAVTIPIPWRPPKVQISSYDFWKLNSKGQNSTSLWNQETKRWKQNCFKNPFACRYWLSCFFIKQRLICKNSVDRCWYMLPKFQSCWRFRSILHRRMTRIALFFC